MINTPVGPRRTRKADMIKQHVSPLICNFLRVVASERCGVYFALLLHSSGASTQAPLEELSIWAVRYDFKNDYSSVNHFQE